MTEERRAGERQALGALREGLPLVQDDGGERREAEGGQRELGAVEAKRGERQERAEDRAERRGQEDGGRDAEPEPGHADRGGVGAQAEEGRLGQVHLPEVAHRDVEPDEQDAVDGEQGEQAERVGVLHHERDGRQQEEEGELGAADEEETFQH